MTELKPRQAVQIMLQQKSPEARRATLERVPEHLRGLAKAQFLSIWEKLRHKHRQARQPVTVDSPAPPPPPTAQPPQAANGAPY